MTFRPLHDRIAVKRIDAEEKWPRGNDVVMPRHIRRAEGLPALT